MTGPRGDRSDGGFSPRAMAAVVVCVTLIAGILVGIGLDRAFIRPRHGPFGPFVPSPAKSPVVIMGKFAQTG